MKSPLEQLAALVKEHEPNLAFNVLEVGARQIANEVESFYTLIDLFPESRLIGFEVDPELCEEMNRSSSSQYHYYAQALGGQSGEADFYETVHPMCASLYKPNEALVSMYNGMEVALLQNTSQVSTITLDEFVAQHDIPAIDYIKIDCQGAELDIFQSGVNCLKDTSFIVTEVEFIELYEKQPLFGDVSKFLSAQQFMFHKFLGLAGRALKPVILGGNVNTTSQQMWSDAVFIRNLDAMENLSSEQLLKQALLSFLYGSPDLTYYCLNLYARHNPTSDLHSQMLGIK